MSDTTEPIVTESTHDAVIDADATTERDALIKAVEGLAPDAVRIGLRVKARIITEGSTPLVVFDPIGGSAEAAA